MTKKTNYAADYPVEFEQGRRARLSSVNRADAPFDADTHHLAAWTAGYDSADGEAQRNATMEPVTGARSGSQLETVAAANSAKK